MILFNALRTSDHCPPSTATALTRARVLSKSSAKPVDGDSSDDDSSFVRQVDESAMDSAWQAHRDQLKDGSKKKSRQAHRAEQKLSHADNERRARRRGGGGKSSSSSFDA